MAFTTITILTPFIDTPDIDDGVLVTDTCTDVDDDMNGGDADDDMTNEDHKHSQANEDEDEDNDGSICGKTSGILFFI
jgi:hypothetical protein